MTTEQRLIELGREQGFDQGYDQGYRQGVQRGRELMLIHLLQQRFGAGVYVHVEQRIAAASLDQLEAWSLCMLSATTLADVFAD